MESLDLVDDKKKTRALDAFCELGRGGGFEKCHIWLSLDDCTVRAKRDCPNNLSILEMTGIKTKKWYLYLAGDGSIPSNLVTA